MHQKAARKITEFARGTCGGKKDTSTASQYQSAVTITDASDRTFHGVVRTYKPAHSAAEAFDSSAVKNSRF